MREAIQLAFIATIQLLPARQRAVLLLRDVLGWSASEAARLLNSSTAAVNSALQRARATLAERLSLGPPCVSALTGGEERALLERYVRAWETTDVDEFTALLHEDAQMSMPPWRQWYRGRSAIATFFAATGRPGGHAPFRLLPTAANGQTAFAFYSRWQSSEWRFHSIQVLELNRSTIERMTSFVMPALASVFGLPNVLPPQDATKPVCGICSATKNSEKLCFPVAGEACNGRS
jgi:RNA polymerase sigma-70 factor (ECF subfamily)